MNAADKNRATQQIQICVGENAFNFINVLVRETDFLQRFHSMFNVQQQTQLSNPNRRIVECQRKFCGIFCNFLQIVQTRFQKIILKDGKELLLLINSEITREMVGYWCTSQSMYFPVSSYLNSRPNSGGISACDMEMSSTKMDTNTFGFQ